MIYKNEHSRLIHRLNDCKKAFRANVEVLKYTRNQFWDEYCGIEPEIFEKLYNEDIIDCRNKIKNIVIEIKKIKKQIKNLQRYGMGSSK